MIGRMINRASVSNRAPLAVSERHLMVAFGSDGPVGVKFKCIGMPLGVH